MVVDCLRIGFSRGNSIQVSCYDTLSSSTAEACTVSRVIKTASCFRVPLSRKEWPKTMAPFLAVNLYGHANRTSCNHQVDSHHSLVTVTYFVSGMRTEGEPTMTYRAIRLSPMIRHGSVWLDASKSPRWLGDQVVEWSRSGVVQFPYRLNASTESGPYLERGGDMLDNQAICRSL